MLLQGPERLFADDMFHSACINGCGLLIYSKGDQEISQCHMLFICPFCNLSPWRKEGDGALLIYFDISFSLKVLHCYRYAGLGDLQPSCQVYACLLYTSDAADD